MELAKVSKLPVLAVVADVQEEVAKPDELAVVELLTKAPVMAVRPTGEVVEVAQVVQTTAPPARVAASPAPAQSAEPVLLAQNTQNGQDTLPATASSLPLIALSGLLAFGAAMALRFGIHRA